MALVLLVLLHALEHLLPWLRDPRRLVFDLGLRLANLLELGECLVRRALQLYS